MKRTRFEIMVDILSSANEGANKTKIVYDAYINFKQANDYLNSLMDAELIIKDSDGDKTIYQTTDKGLEMLEKYKELIELNP